MKIDMKVVVITLDGKVIEMESLGEEFTLTEAEWLDCCEDDEHKENEDEN